MLKALDRTAGYLREGHLTFGIHICLCVTNMVTAASLGQIMLMESHRYVTATPYGCRLMCLGQIFVTPWVLRFAKMSGLCLVTLSPAMSQSQLGTLQYMLTS